VVIHRGRVVSRTTVTREYADASGAVPTDDRPL
jgi:hypothetical protein